MQHHTRRTQGSKPYAKAIALALVLIVALLIYDRINKHGVPADLFSTLEQQAIETRGWEQYEQHEKDSVRKAIAGFWVFDTDSADQSPLRLHDRIELQATGIIWRVMQIALVLPTSDTARAMLVSHAYANPYARIVDAENTMLSEVRLIRRARVEPHGTCLGAGNVDIVWTVEADGSMFGLEGRRYKSYGDKDLASFFPGGAIDIIDEPFQGQQDLSPKEMYEKREKLGVHGASGVFAMQECAEEVDLPNTVRLLLIRHFAGATAGKGSEDIVRAARRYYVPLCLLPRLGWADEISGRPEIAFDVLADGSVANALVKAAPGTRAKSAERTIVAEVESWRFARRAGGGQTVRVRVPL